MKQIVTVQSPQLLPPHPSPLPEGEGIYRGGTERLQQILLKDKFPVFTLDILKSETTFNNTDEVIDYLKSKIEEHPAVRFIAIFDHYGHVKALEKGEIDESIVDSKNVIFCMSGAIRNAMIAAVRPRAIAVNELSDEFVANFMEAPMEAPTNTMVEWVSSIKNASLKQPKKAI